MKRIKKTVKVYNFEVKDNHNYYVSELEILVHNNCFGFNITKAVNSNMAHAIERGLQQDRAVFKTVDEAQTALNAIKDYISKHKAFPSGSIKDPSYLDRVLVPVGDNGMEAYQIGKNGTAKLKTILVAK